MGLKHRGKGGIEAPLQERVTPTGVRVGNGPLVSIFTGRGSGGGNYNKIGTEARAFSESSCWRLGHGEGQQGENCGGAFGEAGWGIL